MQIIDCAIKSVLAEIEKDIARKYVLKKLLLTQDLFSYTYRGQIAAKGKGEISMYFVGDKA